MPSLIHGFQLDGSVVTELLVNHYNPKCEPAWTFAELEHKVIDAAKTKPNKPSGYLLKGREKKIGTISRPMRKTPVPKVDPVENIQKFIGNFRCQEQDLIDASPYELTGIIQGEHFHRQGAMLIEYLYEADDLIRIVTSSRESEKGKHHPVGFGQTLPRNVWSSAILQAPQHKSEGGCWIGMNPVDGNGVADKT